MDSPTRPKKLEGHKKAWILPYQTVVNKGTYSCNSATGLLQNNWGAQRWLAWPTWIVLVIFTAGFTVPIAGLIAAGVFLFKLIFSLASTTLVTFSAATLCCLREFNISRASCTFPFILNRASFWTSFSRASLTPSLCRASVRPIFCRASNVRWKLTAGDDLLRRFCWIPMRDLTPPNTGLVLSLKKKKKRFRHYKAWYCIVVV